MAFFLSFLCLELNPTPLRCCNLALGGQCCTLLERANPALVHSMCSLVVDLLVCACQVCLLRTCGLIVGGFYDDDCESSVQRIRPAVRRHLLPLFLWRQWATLADMHFLPCLVLTVVWSFASWVAGVLGLLAHWVGPSSICKGRIPAWCLHMVLIGCAC